jgi:O-antigen/teichoic acid export membrane protein
VWALVFGVLAREISLVVGSYIAHPYRPRLSGDRQRMIELYRFGIWIFVSAILSYLSANLDDVVVGRVLDVTALGFYTTAFTLSSFTGEQVTGVINDVAFPAYSRLQSDKPRLRNAYMRTFRVVVVVALPATAGLWFVGPQLVETLMGAKWLPMIPAFNVLLIWGLLRSLGATTSPLLFATGRPDINTKAHFASVVLLAAAIYPMTTHGGIVGAAWATVVTGLVPVGFVIYLTGRYLSTASWDLTRAITIPALCTAIMILVLSAVKYAWPSAAGGWLLAWAPPIGIIVYGGAILGARRFLGYPLG